MSRRLWVLVVSVVGVVGLLAGCSTVQTGAQLKPQDYGKGAQYQVEVSLNCTSLQNCTLQNVIGKGAGFGIWLWLELNGNGKGDYTGADCGHNMPGDPARAGAFAAKGDLTWNKVGDQLVISGVSLLDHTVPVTITVPSTLGHSNLPNGILADGTPVFQVTDSNSPFAGLFRGGTQVQVAP